MSNFFNKRCYGLIVIKSENSNFNADFTGNPRRLPDQNGTIYATDKAMKYAIRRFWVDQKKDVFVWKSHNKDGNVRTRDERMAFMTDYFYNKGNDHNDLKNLVDMKKWLEQNKKAKKPDDIEKKEDDLKNELINSFYSEIKTKEILDKELSKEIEKIKKELLGTVFSKCIDTRLFGITFTGDKEGILALEGPVQISYGINKYKENINYILDIIAPYPTSDEKTDQSTIGKDKKTLEAYYVYDFSINPQNIITHYNDNEELLKKIHITDVDITSLKEACKNAVTALDSTSKKDSENVMLLFVTMPENSKHFLPSMKNLVNIQKDNNKIKIDLIKVKEVIDQKGIESVELYYNEKLIEVITDENNKDNKEEQKNWKTEKSL